MDIDLPDDADAAWLEQQPPQSVAACADALFARLLDRAGQSRVSSVHACAQLCSFVQQCARAKSQAESQAESAATANAISGWVFQTSTALRLLRFYMECNETDQHRSLRLVLDAVVLLVARNPDMTAQAELRADILQALVAVIGHQSTRPLVKSAIGSLHYLLGKGVYRYEEVAVAYGALSSEPSSEPSSKADPLAVWHRLVDDMFSWMTLHYVCPAAGKLLVAVFSHLRSTMLPGFTVDLWLQWLCAGLASHAAILEDVKLYVFIPLFKADRDSSLELLQSLNEAVDVDATLRLAALEVGKKAGLVDDGGLSLSLKPGKPSSKSSSKSSKQKPNKTITLNEDVLDDVLAQASADVRSLALSLLVSSQSTTKPYSATALLLLRRYLPAYHAAADAKFRYELLAHTRDMAVRLKSAILLMEKWLLAPVPTGEEDVDVDNVRRTLADHESFLQWYLSFLTAELAPTASYQRHVTSLKATAWLLRQRRDVAGTAPDALDHDLARRLFSDAAWLRCVLDRLMDPFDDVRDTAAALLALAPRDVVDRDMLAVVAGRADARAAMTARQDHADGAARCHALRCVWAATHADRVAILHSVLDALDGKLAFAEADLAAAAVAAPVHGDFAAIRYIWGVLAKEKYTAADDNDDKMSALHAVQARIVGSCERVWLIVQHVLCDDSPEGLLLPDDADDTAVLDSKDLLSYSFRAVNEASSAMRAMVAPLRFRRVAGTLVPSSAVFAAIGHLAFTQLAALRHRGALTTVAQTFTLCCQLADDPELVARWYAATLDCIHTQRSTTRRSAGIPSLFSGILASNAPAPAPAFDDAVRALCVIAQQPPDPARHADGSHLPQVHAFNCLRDVFRSSLLSARAERLLPECLQLAANSLRSDVWAIRNCALLLLRSLIDCLFGTAESKAALASGWDGRTVRLSYNKYPALPDVLLSLLAVPDATTNATTTSAAAISHHLQIQSQQAAAESVFPALDILRRAGAPDSHRDLLYAAVCHYLASTLWHVREMAARTVCALVIVNDWAAALFDLLVAVDEATATANQLHGTLLAFRLVLARVAELEPESVPDHLPRLTADLDALAAAHVGFASCPDVRAAYLEARNTVCDIALQLSLPLADFVLPDFVVSSSSSSSSPSSTPSALLTAQSVLHANYAAAARNDYAALDALVASVAVADPDTATRLLDALPPTWSDRPRLCTVYIRVARESHAAPLVRAAALRHLADALDCLLRLPDSPGLPSTDDLLALWTSLANAAVINPTLSWAILRISGAITAVAAAFRLASTSTSTSTSTLTELTMSAWIRMVHAAGHPDQTFDTRMAAAEAQRSFACACAASLAGLAGFTDTDLLSWYLCLYDCLQDDDDEIRDVAADAAATLLGKPLIASEAARQLPQWTSATLGKPLSFVAWGHAAARMLGQPYNPGRSRSRMDRPLQAWPPAAPLLDAALRQDDALFQVEEQNLFIDEVREAERWGLVIQHWSYCPIDDALATWIADGLDALVRRTKDNAVDGPLGWTAAPAVFAVCARFVVGARSVLCREGPRTAQVDRLESLLDDFRQAGAASQVHGLLLAMAKTD